MSTICGMVGHAGQMFEGNAIPRQHAATYQFHQQSLVQPHSQHILATGLAPYIYQVPRTSSTTFQEPPDIPTPPTEQPSPSTSSSSQEGDHPIGYGAFGVVWYVE